MYETVVHLLSKNKKNFIHAHVYLFVFENVDEPYSNSNNFPKVNGSMNIPVFFFQFTLPPKYRHIQTRLPPILQLSGRQCWRHAVLF